MPLNQMIFQNKAKPIEFYRYLTDGRIKSYQDWCEEFGKTLVDDAIYEEVFKMVKYDTVNEEWKNV